MLQNETMLFPVRRAHWYVPRRPLGCSEPGCVGSQGDAFYMADNPDFGAVFTNHREARVRGVHDHREDFFK